MYQKGDDKEGFNFYHWRFRCLESGLDICEEICCFAHEEEGGVELKEGKDGNVMHTFWMAEHYWGFVLRTKYI